MAKRLTATELKALQKQRRSASQASQSVESISTSYALSDTPKYSDSVSTPSFGLSSANSISLHVSDIDLSLNSNLSRLGTSSDSLGELNIKSSGSFGNLKLSSESIQQSVSEAQVSLSRNGSDITLGRSSQSQPQTNGTSTRIFSESISSESQPEFNAKLFFKTANVKKEEPIRPRSLFDMKTPEMPSEVDSPKERSSKRRRIDENKYEETKIEIKTEIKEENGTFKMEIDQPEENPEKDLGPNFVCDWSIKTRIKLSSYQTFDWCGMISSQLESIAATMFVKGVVSADLLTVHGVYFELTYFQPDTSSIDIPRVNLSSPIPATTHIDFDKSLYYFAYPGSLIPEYLQEMYYSAIQHEEEERDDLLKAAHEDWYNKKTEWAESFKSLFFLLKSKHCQYFYCIFDNFCVLFLTPGLAGYTRPTAIINKSTKRFRRLLEQSDVPFTMPLLKDEDKPKIKSADQEAIKELKEIESLAPKQIKLLDDLPSAIDNEAPSLLLFQGREGVHSLFDFLLNWTAASSVAPEKTTDATIRQKFQIPTLYAPSSFLHAAMKKVVVKTSQFKQMSDKTGDLEELSSLEFDGPLLPSSVISLFDIFKQSHSEFKATMEIEPQSVNFNHNFVSNSAPQATSPTSSPRVSGLISFVPSTMNEQRYVGPEIRKLYYSDSTFKIRQ